MTGGLSWRLPRDMRDTPEWARVQALLAPAPEGAVVDVTDLAVSPDGSRLALTAWRAAADGGSVPHLLVVPTAAGDPAVPSGVRGLRRPAWSPGGSRVVTLADPPPGGTDRVAVLIVNLPSEAHDAIVDPQPDPAWSGCLTGLPPGAVEEAVWSPDGRRLALLLAAPGAELSDVDGSGRVPDEVDDLPPWAPTVPPGPDAGRRTAWVVAPDGPRRVPTDLNIWELMWAGPDHLVTVAGTGAAEDDWYDAGLVLLAVADGTARRYATGDGQVALPRASPDGRSLTAVVALASDRGLVAGDLLCVDSVTGAVTTVPTEGIDISHHGWRDGDRVVAAGVRGLDCAITGWDRRSGRADPRPRVVGALGPADLLPRVAAAGPGDDVAVVLDAPDGPPVAALLGELVIPLVPARRATSRSEVPAERLRWASTGGWEVEGLLHRAAPVPVTSAAATGATAPTGPTAHAVLPGLAVLVHGGPVWCWRDTPAAASPLVVALLDAGWTVLLPNIRGSQGRGPAYRAAIVGEVGGRDLDDVLTGVDAVLARGGVDPGAVVVLGSSYGGYLAARLACIPGRFAAAVAVSPATHWVSQHLTTNIARSDTMFLSGDPLDPRSHYVTRSAVHAVHAGAAPTLLTAGERDLATPAGQAREMWAALRGAGVPADLAVYPLEGHEVLDPAAVPDHLARVLRWLDTWRPRRDDG